MKRLILSSVVSVMFLGLGVASAADKVIETSSGKDRTHVGVVTRDDITGVALRMRAGITPEFARAQVKTVIYDCLAMHYAYGETLYKQSQYDLAVIRFAQAAEDQGVSRWAKQYVYRRLGQCYQKMGKDEDLKKAVEFWDKTLTSIPNKKSVFFREAVEGLLDCHSRLKDWDKAAAAASSLSALGDDGKLMAQVYRARISERRGRYPAAADAYKKVSESSAPTPSEEVRAMALAGLARSSVEAKKWTNGKSAADAIFKMVSKGKNVPDEALAVAYVVKGEFMLRTMESVSNQALSKDTKKIGKVLDGVTDMGRAVFLYEDSSWARARGMYKIGMWSEKLEGASQGPQWTTRAIAMYKGLVDGYKGTKWAERAKGRLKAMKIQ